ncbi:hypothetical protein COS86_00200 [Candidatus Bathyarchaeota archaeon CG07_land_8_20_14_0_80_47_9]|nr:MAG: hypothetical protein COS86_00200 [Candidatus Bathyarchaeota archaeon CG07_land_8_20_14_0_80_47_9]
MLREAGRSDLGLGKKRFADSLIARKIIDYVVDRQNDDGGYTFCQGAESNAQDTYYGLAILEMLGSSFPHVERTVTWLRELDLGSIYSYNYVSKALVLCGENPGNCHKECIVSAIRSGRYFGDVDVYVEVSSEFTLTLSVLELAKMLNIEVDGGRVERWLLEYRNEDCGFGAHGYSNVISTYYAVASLNLLKNDVTGLRETEGFVRECEKPFGGFTVIPRSAPPYMEHTYYGVMTLDLLGENCRFPSQTIDFVLKCQRDNGGFARSDLGISTFENTFHAVSIMQRLAST